MSEIYTSEYTSEYTSDHKHCHKWRSIISTRVCLKPNFVAICLCINMYTDEYSIVNTKTSLWVSLFMFAYHYTSCNMSRIKNNDWSLVKLYLYIPRKFSKYFGFEILKKSEFQKVLQKLFEMKILCSLQIIKIINLVGYFQLITQPDTNVRFQL